MSRSITVFVTTTDETPRKATLEISVGTTSWQKFEVGGANHVFTTKGGNYRYQGSGGAGSTELLRPGGGIRAGVLRGFSPATVVENDTGQGLSDDVGSGLTWKAGKIIDI